MGDQPQKAPRRLKGKARKQARDSSAREPARGGNYLIKRTDFIPMAQKIAEQLAKVHIPALVERTFNRVISERRRVSDWFRSSHGKTDTGDERYLHFIGVLEGAFATLCPFKEIKVKPRATRTFGPPQVGPLPLHNAFAGLQVDVSPNELHEPQAAPAVDSDHDNETPPRIASVEIEREESEIEEEFFFAIECFLEEVHAIRSLLRNAWNEYKRSGYDLVIAALLTNTAVELVRQAEEQLDLMVYRPTKYPAAAYPVWTFPAILFYHLHKSVHNQPIEMVVLPSKGVTVVHGEDCDHADWCLFHAYNGIKYYLYRTRQIGANASNALADVSKEIF